MSTPTFEECEITVVEKEYGVEDTYTADGIKITWPNGSVTEETVYEMHDYEYVPEFDLVLIHGHEEILLVKEDGTRFKTYTR